MMSTELFDRLKKNLKKRQRLIKAWPTEAYRLYEKDLPSYPFIVDIFHSEKTWALVWFKGKKRFEDDDLKEEFLREQLQALLEIPSNQIILKRRHPQGPLKQYQKTSSEGQIIAIKEGNASFLLNLTDYMDTGLFLDHRPLRRWVSQELAKLSSPRFLNLFSYTCSVSVMAALAGAKTVNLDLSQTYLAWGEENFKLNRLDLKDHQFIRASIQELHYHKIGLFDLIYIDPPTFSNSKRSEDFDVQLHHAEILIKLKKYLTPQGKIYFSCNKRDFKLAPELSAHYQINDKTKQSLPEDFNDEKIHHCFELRV